MADAYTLLDSGDGRKLERFGRFTISRPCSQAVWDPCLDKSHWDKADAIFLREGDTKWIFNNSKANSQWQTEAAGINFNISPTDFGHLGLFPEQRDFWQWIIETITKSSERRNQPIQVLNLFAYSGGATLAAAKAGAHVCHLDASKGMVEWARENASLNNLEKAPIRWIVDDVRKFLARELRREKHYDAIILDPPSFGRGSKGEIFKIEEHIREILSQCRQLLTKQPLFLLFSCHTSGFTPIAMHHLLSQTMKGLPGNIDQGEMVLTGSSKVLPVPSGTFARWIHES